METLHSAVSLWVWGALLCRDTLSVAHNVFTFIDRFEHGFHRWWHKARAEVRGMAYILIGLRADLGAPLLPLVFATDAEGQNSADHGGYGVTATVVTERLAYQLARAGTRPVRTIANLDGDSSVLRHPERVLRRTTPFSSIPSELRLRAQDLWTVLSHGRWKWGDHNTLGEARASLKLLNML